MKKTHVLPGQLALPFSADTTASTACVQTVPPPIPDYAMWVGGQFYPTPQDYIDEAERLGCSKRLPRIPEDLVIGKSRVYLAHGQMTEHIAQDPIIRNFSVSWRSRTLALARKLRDGKITREDALQQLPKAMTQRERMLDTALAFIANEHSVVFGYFIVTRLEFIVPPDGAIPDKIKELAAQDHVKLVAWREAQAEADRGCGRRKPGGCYAAAYVDDEGVEALRYDAKADIHGPLAVFHQPFTAPFGFFRGIKRLTNNELAYVGVVATLIGEKERT